MPSAPAFDERFRQRLGTLLTWRRDVQRFRRDLLPPDLVERLIELAALAPSVGLSQPWRFVVVDDAACHGTVRQNFTAANAAALAAEAPKRAAQYARLKLAGLDEAPCHVAVFADRATAQRVWSRASHDARDDRLFDGCRRPYLVARGARRGDRHGWVSILDPRQIAVILDVPVEWKLIGYFCLGYPLGKRMCRYLKPWDGRSGGRRRRS